MVTENNSKPTKQSSLPNIIFSGLIGILVGVVGVLTYKEFSGQIANILLYILLALFGFAILASVLFWALKNYLTRLVFGSEAADALNLIAEGQKFSKALINNLIDNLPQNVYQGDRGLAKNLAHTLGNLLIWGRLRNWWWSWLMSIFVAIGGLSGTLLLVNQNELLQNQNQLIKNQMSLEEASRRGALVVLMSNVFDKVDDEIALQREEMIRKGKVVTDSTKYSLSQSLIGQIAALSQAFKPYRFMDGDTLIGKPLSPERGQLLVTICRLPFDSLTLNKIYENSIFDFADLNGAKLSFALLARISLSQANLTGADLFAVDLNNSILNGANLSECNLMEANLFGSTLVDANLKNANLGGADLGYTEMYGAIFVGAHLVLSDLTESGVYMDQLMVTNSLFGAKLPDTSYELELKKMKPSLFKNPMPLINSNQ